MASEEKVEIKGFTNGGSSVRQLFLFGGSLGPQFGPTARPFLRAAGGKEGRIALLFPSGAPGWDRFLPLYRDPWLAEGGGEVVPILPEADGRLSPAALAELKRATGIFMCGGDTRVYYRVYAQGEVGDAIRAAYAAGIPYAGLSAGAQVAPATASVWGDRLTTPTNQIVFAGAEGRCEAELQLEVGLGLIRDLCVETHFSEEGGFTRLLAAMEVSGASKALGIDEQICVTIVDESRLSVAGQGRAYLVRRLADRRFETQVLEPGEGAAF